MKNINDGKNLKINAKSIAATVCQTILINWTSNFFFFVRYNISTFLCQYVKSIIYILKIRTLLIGIENWRSQNPLFSIYYWNIRQTILNKNWKVSENVPGGFMIKSKQVIGVALAGSLFFFRKKLILVRKQQHYWLVKKHIQSMKLKSYISKKSPCKMHN